MLVVAAVEWVQQEVLILQVWVWVVVAEVVLRKKPNQELMELVEAEVEVDILLLLYQEVLDQRILEQVLVEMVL